MIIASVFILGLIIGSFLNAVIFRLKEDESFIKGRSHCPHCKHNLSSLDLIPLFSFIFLGGRCRYCRKAISWQYPIIELVTAVTFILLAQNFQFSISNFQFWFQCVMAGFLIVIAVYDLKHYLILDKIVFPALAVVTAYNLFTGFFVQGLLGAALIAGFFAAQYYFSNGRWIGFGDVKLGLVLGSIFGFKMGIIMLVLAYFMGAIVGVFLIMTGRKQLGSELPFGVFLSLSAIIMMIAGHQLSAWYYNLIGL